MYSKHISSTSLRAIHRKELAVILAALFAVPSAAMAAGAEQYFSVYSTNSNVESHANATGNYSVAAGTWSTASGLAGVAVGSQSSATKESTIAIGAQAKATAVSATAVGEQANASGATATAVGRQSTASGGQSLAAGSESKATGQLSTALGTNSQASGNQSIAVGVATQADSDNATAVGNQSKATGKSALSLGSASSATGAVSTAVGSEATALNGADTALGRKATARGGQSTAVGSAAEASGVMSLSAGAGSKATASQAVALGRGAVADQASSIALGSASETAPVVRTTSATVNGITYSGFAATAPNSTVSVGKVGAERTVTNVAAGRITADSTDAINGSQLYLVANQVGNNAANINQINNRIDDMDDDLRAGIAGATAIAFLQRPNEAGKSMVSVGVGGYRGEQALAVGYARNSDNNKWSTKAGVGINTQRHLNWGGSVGYQW
ncbi:YadA-like family protein [Neisseria arctica]|uniref:YadA-like family protein n=1 Tax=Neisseria arctica TaxID=1470200 RepID=UPI00064A6EC6|nr:YadA-like family protein [Neisseria arctica]UOO86762.1 YadA-like family protein [Neisseria arctica]